MALLPLSAIDFGDDPDRLFPEDLAEDQSKDWETVEVIKVLKIPPDIKGFIEPDTQNSAYWTEGRRAVLASLWLYYKLLQKRLYGAKTVKRSDFRNWLVTHIKSGYFPIFRLTTCDWITRTTFKDYSVNSQLDILKQQENQILEDTNEMILDARLLELASHWQKHDESERTRSHDFWENKRLDEMIRQEYPRSLREIAFNIADLIDELISHDAVLGRNLLEIIGQRTPKTEKVSTYLRRTISFEDNSVNSQLPANE